MAKYGVQVLSGEGFGHDAHGPSAASLLSLLLLQERPEGDNFCIRIRAADRRQQVQSASAGESQVEDYEVRPPSLEFRDGLLRILRLENLLPARLGGDFADDVPKKGRIVDDENFLRRHFAHLCATHALRGARCAGRAEGNHSSGALGLYNTGDANAPFRQPRRPAQSVGLFDSTGRFASMDGVGEPR